MVTAYRQAIVRISDAVIELKLRPPSARRGCGVTSESLMVI